MVAVTRKRQFKVAGAFSNSTMSRPCTRSAAAEEKGTIVTLPSAFKGESLRRLLQGLALGVAATMIIGFSWGGWMTTRSAQEMARQRSDAALVSALAPICVDKFRNSNNVAANTDELKKTTSFMQGSFIARGGWATTIGSNEPNSVVADACANMLSSMAK